jgi:hypothetical protein
MAVLTAVSSVGRDFVTHTWSGLGATDLGVGVQAFRYIDKTVQSYISGAGGQFGTSSLFVEGSNNSTDGQDGNWIFVHDPQGNDIQLSVTSGQIEALLENPRWVRPRVGTGTASLVSIVLFGVHF